MQSKSTGRFATGIQARDDLIIAIDDLAFRIDLEAGQGVMQDRRRPCRIERRAHREGSALDEFSSAWVKGVVFLGHVLTLVKW